MRAVPEPKLAMSVGAYTELRRLPNCWRTAAVATMTSECSGVAVVGSSSSRWLTWCALSSRHMAGSQATTADRLTWPATHAAACSRSGD